MRTLNLGILAHVDAGKTSLTERLLYAAGVIDKIGRVDDGDTQTDSLALERQRGITIKSAVVSFVVGDTTINLIDTPGHPDFIAEVERVLNVLDGAVLVISAVEGVQAQTRILMRTLKRLQIPTLIFVNKIDRGGANAERALQAIAERLAPAIVAMSAAIDIGARGAAVTAYGADDRVFLSNLTELLAERDETVLAAYVGATTSFSYDDLRRELARQSKTAQVHPVFFGSAITGAGVDQLTDGITEFLPATEGDADGPLSAAVFKIERGPAGERIAYARIFSGTIRMRDRLQIPGRDGSKATAIGVFESGGLVMRSMIKAGHIGKFWGLGDIRIGDAIGIARTNAALHHFTPPTLETVILPRRATDKGALHTALAELAEQDPLINLRQDDVHQEIFVSLYGEVQKEVIHATLTNDYNVEVEFRETTTICIERPIGVGAALETAPYPFIASIGLRIAPAPIDAAIQFKTELEFGSLPASFEKAVEDGVRDALRQGLHGWPVIGCIATMTQSIRLRHWATSNPAEHRKLAPLVAMAALKRAGTIVCEPIHRFRLETPADTLPAILPMLARLRAIPQSPTTQEASCVLEGEIAAARSHELQGELPALTRGEGVIEFVFDRYEPVHGQIPNRARTDHNPLDRKEYLLHVKRHI